MKQYEKIMRKLTTKILNGFNKKPSKADFLLSQIVLIMTISKQ